MGIFKYLFVSAQNLQASFRQLKMTESLTFYYNHKSNSAKEWLQKKKKISSVRAQNLNPAQNLWLVLITLRHARWIDFYPKRQSAAFQAKGA